MIVSEHATVLSLGQSLTLLAAAWACQWVYPSISLAQERVHEWETKWELVLAFAWGLLWARVLVHRNLVCNCIANRQWRMSTRHKDNSEMPVSPVRLPSLEC